MERGILCQFTPGDGYKDRRRDSAAHHDGVEGSDQKGEPSPPLAPGRLADNPLTGQDLDCRNGTYRHPEVITYGWRGATIGILGMGNIGIRVADMATSMGMKVVYSNRRKVPNVPYEHMSREEMYKVVDVLVVLTPLTEETKGLLNKEGFAKMRDGIMIVNVGKLGPNQRHIVSPFCRD